MLDKQSLNTYYLINNLNHNICKLPTRLKNYIIVFQEEDIYVYDEHTSKFCILKIYNPNEIYDYENIENIICYQQSLIIILNYNKYSDYIQQLDKLFNENKNLDILYLLS